MRIWPSLMVVLLIVVLVGCPAVDYPIDSQQSWQLEPVSVVYKYNQSVSGNELELYLRLSDYSKDTFIDLPDSDIDRVDVVIWYAGGCLLVTGPDFQPEASMLYLIPNIFPEDTTNIAVTLIAHHRYLDNPSTGAINGCYWAYLPKLDCAINGEFWPEERDDNNQPLGFFAVPLNELSSLPEPSIIEINNNNTQYLIIGEPYIEKGAVAFDDYDRDISSQIVISGSVDTSRIGTYKINYDVADSSGNQAFTAVRTVVVVAKPVMSYVNFSYLSRYPKGQLNVAVSLNTTTMEVLFRGLPSAAQTAQIACVRYYDGLPTPPWITYEGADFNTSDYISFMMSPGRSKNIKINLVAIDYDGNIYFANPDYIQAYYNRQLVSADNSGAWNWNIR